MYQNFRDKSIRTFISGDYELLCKMFGTSGATGSDCKSGETIIKFVIVGRHCCLWCHITQQDLKPAPQSLNPQPQLRSLATLATAYSGFTSQGHSNTKLAKLHYNVISAPIFAIPLDQVQQTCSGVSEMGYLVATIHCRSAFQDCTLAWVSIFGFLPFWKMLCTS